MTGSMTGPTAVRSRPVLRTVEGRSAPGAVTVLADVVVVAACCLVSLTALASTYGGRAWLVAGAGGVLAGLGVAGASARLRLTPWPTALALALAYVLVGSVVAAPKVATAGFVPNASTVRVLATGVVHAWRDSLTAFTPLGSAGNVLVVPFALCLLASCATGLVLWRVARPGLAVVPLGLHLLACVAFGEQLAGRATTRGVVVVVLLVAWTQWRGLRQSPARWVRRIGLAAALLALAGAAGTGVATAVAASGPREVLRDHVTPPFDPQDYKSPLSKYRAYVKDLKSATLFTYRGAPAKTRVRLAVMDRWDGTVWNVSGGPGSAEDSGTFTRAPGRAPSGDRSATVTVSIGSYQGPWVPSAGDPTAITVTGPGAGRSQAGLLVNRATGTVAEVGGVRHGSTYLIHATIDPRPSDATIAAADGADLSLPEAAAPPDQLVRKAQGWAAKAQGRTAGAIALAIENGFRSEGFFSDGQGDEYPSAAGHGYARLAAFFRAEHLVGDGEQYAAAMALALRALSIPARVVLGFDTTATSGEVTGRQVLAWVEVDLRDLGWVSFSPTPDRDKKLPKQDDQPNPQPQPQVLNPPDVPQDPQQDADDVGRGRGSAPDSSSFAWLGVAAKVLGGLMALGLLSAPLWLVVLVKSVRRRRRREHLDPVTALSGGWREVTDGARDLGVRIPASSTRYETSVVLAERFPQAATAPLGVIADRHVFGDVEPTPEQIDDYWRDVATVCHDMRAGAPRWRQWAASASLATFDLRSLPRRTAISARGVAAHLRPGWLSVPDVVRRVVRASQQRVHVALARRRRRPRP